MVKVCGRSLCVPLKIIFENTLATGIFPEANVTPVHSKNDKQKFKLPTYFASLNPSQDLKGLSLKDYVITLM